MNEPMSASDRPGAYAQAVLGAQAMLPVMVGAIPFALALGALAAQKGLSPLEVALMSSLVFAGSAQFAAVELWSTPAAVGALGLTALLINLRHVLMGVALSPHLREFGGGVRPLALFVMADEVWAIAMRRARDLPLTPAFYFGLGATLWVNWVVFSTLGALSGPLIEDPVAYGLDFAFVAIFMALLRSFWTGRASGTAWAASALAAILFSRLAEGPWYVLAGAIAGMGTATLVSIIRPEGER